MTIGLNQPPAATSTTPSTTTTTTTTTSTTTPTTPTTPGGTRLAIFKNFFKYVGEFWLFDALTEITHFLSAASNANNNH